MIAAIVPRNAVCVQEKTRAKRNTVLFFLVRGGHDVAGADDGDGARGVVGEVAADRAEEGALQAVQAAAANDNAVGVVLLAGRDKVVARIPRNKVRLHIHIGPHLWLLWWWVGGG